MEYREWLYGRGDRAFEDLVGGTLGYFGQYLTGADASGHPRFGFIRTVDWDFRTQLGARRWEAGVSALGALQESEDGAAVWQLRGYGSEGEAFGANAGLAYRRVLPSMLLGVNAFLDWESNREYDEQFLRYSLGVEAKTALLGLHGNSYSAITGSDRDEPTRAYTRDGFDLGVQVHAPGREWLSGGLTYYKWDGEYGDADDKGLRYNLAVVPVRQSSHRLRLEVEYEDAVDGGGDWGGQVSYQYFPEGRPGSAGAQFDPRAQLFAPVRREHAQRISLAGGGALLATVVVSRGTASLYVGRDDPVQFDPALHNPFNYALDIGLGTALESDAMIMADSGTWTLALSESTRIDFVERGTIVSLANGTLFVDRSGELREIRTGNARITLEGTMLTVGYEAGVTSIDALEGTIRIDAGGNSNAVRVATIGVNAVVYRDNEILSRPDPPGGIRVFSFASDGVTVEEGETATVIIELQPRAHVGVTITLEAAEGSSVGDLGVTRGCVSSPEGKCVIELAKDAEFATVVVTVLQDTDPGEPQESVLIQFEGDAPAGFEFDSGTFALSILVNDAPVWQQVSAPAATAGEAYRLDLSALVSDPEGGTITCSDVGVSLPAGFVIDSASCVISSADVTADRGTYPVVIRAEDPGGETAEVRFNLTVARVFAFAATGATVEEGATAALTLTVTPDAHEAVNITLEAAGSSSAAAGDWEFAGGCDAASPAGKCIVSFAVGDDDAVVMVSAVQDSEAGEPLERVILQFEGDAPAGFEFDSGTYTLSIAVNNAPVWQQVSAPAATAGEAYRLDLSALVSDPEGGTITCSDVGGSLPAGFVIDSASCVISSADVTAVRGTYSVVIRAADPGAETAEVRFNLTVADRVFAFAATGATVEEGATAALTLTVTPDAHVAVNITLEAAGSSSAAAGDWEFAGGCDAASPAGKCIVSFAVGDDDAVVMVSAVQDSEAGEPLERVILQFEGDAPAGFEFDSGTYALSIAVNNAPVWQQVSAPEAIAGAAYRLDLSSRVSDPEGGAIECTEVGSSLPAGFSLASATCVISSAGVTAGAGTHQIMIQAADPGGETAAVTFALTVRVSTGRRIEFAVPREADVFEGTTEVISLTVTPAFSSATTITISSSDNQSDWEFIFGCENALPANTCTVEFLANIGSAGIGVAVIASDAVEEADESVTLAFVGTAPSGATFEGGGFEMTIPRNQPPLWESVSAQTAGMGIEFEFDLNPFVSDPEDVTYTCSELGTTLPTGITLGGINTCELSADSVSQALGIVTASIVATDASGATATAAIMFTVEAPANRIRFAEDSATVIEGRLYGLTIQFQPPIAAETVISLQAQEPTINHRWRYVDGCARTPGSSCRIEVPADAASAVVSITIIAPGARTHDSVTFALTSLPPTYASGGDFRLSIRDNAPPQWGTVPAQNLGLNATVDLNLNDYITEREGDMYICSFVGAVADTLSLALGGVNDCELTANPLGAGAGPFNVTVRVSDAFSLLTPEQDRIISFSVAEVKLPVTGSPCVLALAARENRRSFSGNFSYIDTSGCDPDATHIRVSETHGFFTDGISLLVNIYFSNLPSEGRWQVQISGNTGTRDVRYFYNGVANNDFLRGTVADPGPIESSETASGAYDFFFTQATAKTLISSRNIGTYITYGMGFSSSSVAGNPVTIDLVKVP